MAESTQRPVSVVVGVGPGLGAALARRFAAGYTVAVLARREDYLATLVKEIESAGGRALAVPTDVSQAEHIEKAFNTIRTTLGVCREKLEARAGQIIHNQLYLYV
jgi:NAD(P)-dependent dehydrogenase (short-subunit alcohol dehydrogenase family)